MTKVQIVSKRDSFASFDPQDQILDSNCSIDADKVLERSLQATQETVFLTWHNVCFTVPMLKQDYHIANNSSLTNYIDIDDPRVQLIGEHNDVITKGLNSTNSTLSNNISVTGSNPLHNIVGKNKK